MPSNINFPFPTENLDKMTPDDLTESAKAMKQYPKHIANANLAALVIPEITKLTHNPILQIAWFIDPKTEDLVVENKRLPLKELNSATKAATKLVEINNTTQVWKEETRIH